jgi:hypothetical protein
MIIPMEQCDCFHKKRVASRVSANFSSGGTAMNNPEQIIIPAWLTDMLVKYPLGKMFTIEHDGFVGTVCGYYQRADGKLGVCLQLDDAKVIHVYGEKWLA